MTPNFPSLKTTGYPLPVALATSILLLNIPSQALAQVAEVPRPDSNGDFTTAFVQGNLGYYANKQWLVVAQSGDPRDGFLNCRYAPNGEIRSRVPSGAIVEAVFLGEFGEPNPPRMLELNPANDAIILEDGAPWLRVRGTSGLFYPARAGDWESLGECYVRANWQYIAPVNNDWSLPGR